MLKRGLPITWVIAPAKPGFPITWEIALTVLAASLFVLFGIRSGHTIDMAFLALCYGFLALGMYVPFNLCGSLSLGYNAYFAVGAYSVAILSNSAPAWILFSLPLALVISAVLAGILGYLTRKLSGFHLALATLMFGIATQRWLVNTTDVTGGAAGLGGFGAPDIFGIGTGREQLLVVATIVIWFIAFGISRIRGSAVGIAWRVQRESSIAAEASGVPTVRMRLFALMIGAAIASIGGIVLALANGFVVPESFPVSVVFLVLFMPLLGGTGSPWGALIGAGIVVFLTVGFTGFGLPGALTFALFTLAVLIIAPKGILGIAGQLFERLRLSKDARP